MSYYFYCPKCGYELKNTVRPKGTVANPRDGYGKMIFHFECPKCHNLDAGYMQNCDCSEAERNYYRKVIGMYQDIRGYAETK